VVEEALDAYLTELRADEVDLLLSLEASIDDADEGEMRRRIEEARATWRVS
jgi:hypothetical protein